MRRTVATVVFTTMVMACGGGSDDAGGVPDGTASMASAPDGDSTSDDAIGESVGGDDLETLLNSEPVYADLILDGSTRVEAEIVATSGGELTTTSATGDVYTLIIPPNALPFDEVVSLTAAAGDDVSGVDIAPDGLQLRGVAVIEIVPAAPFDGAQPVWWDGTGELNRPVAAAGDDGVIRFVTDHFSGYGTAAPDSTIPAPTAIDESMGRLRQLLSEVARQQTRGDSGDFSGAEAELAKLWKSYVKPLLKSAKGSGCGANQIFRETVRFMAMVQVLGFEQLDNASQTELDAQVDVLYEEMKNCARQECAAGKLEAPAHMLKAVSIGQLFGSAKAETEGSDILQEVVGSGATSPWAKCRMFDAFLSVKMNWDLRLAVPEFTNLNGVSIGKGVLMPGNDGHSGDIGTYETSSGMADFVSRNGSMLLTGIAKGFGALMGVDPGDQKVSCTESSSNRGLVNVSLSWDSGTYPLATIKPLSSPITVTCTSNAGTETSALPNPAYLLLTLDPNTQTQSDVFQHQFTAADLWPSAGLSSTPLGFQWKELIDVQPLIVADGEVDFSRRADTSVTLKLILGSTHSPRDQVPAPDGLIPPSQGLVPLAGS